MAAPLNPNQLKMFMTAQELHDTDSIDVAQRPDSRFGGAWKSKDDMWKTKKRENKWDRRDESVAADGVQKPVVLTSGKDVDGQVILDGHHRIQAAYDHDPQSYVPVGHHDLDKGLIHGWH